MRPWHHLWALYYVTYRNVKNTCLVKSLLHLVPRGRPRDPRTRAAILAAARALLERGGPTSVTIGAIAQKRPRSAGPTIYRYWPNAPAVAIARPPETTGADDAA